MTALPEITFIEEARKAGAHSYIYKNAGTEHLFYTIRSTMKGLGLYPGQTDSSPFAIQFTEKEIAVVRLVCQGLSRSEMVKELGISESMLKPIITSILDKTGFESIMKFAVYAVGRGLIVPSAD
jgi:DNA-binding NarL/FixJ family response regulator